MAREDSIPHGDPAASNEPTPAPDSPKAGPPQTIRPVGIRDESPGGPHVLGPPQAIEPAGIPPDESVGKPTAASGRFIHQLTTVFRTHDAERFRRLIADLRDAGKQAEAAFRQIGGALRLRGRKHISRKDARRRLVILADRVDREGNPINAYNLSSAAVKHSRTIYYWLDRAEWQLEDLRLALPAFRERRDARKLN
jgi:hypothetical protein